MQPKEKPLSLRIWQSRELYLFLLPAVILLIVFNYLPMYGITIAFKDFRPHLGIMGGSQGGLFMGAMLTQRPDLINAAVIQVPLFDMLRFHKLLAGDSWKGEYGDPDIPEQRAWIAEYSPYQRLSADAPYPQVFIHTSTKDDRVHPGHARKAAARLEELGHDVLFYENTDGGHAAGANLRETARRVALEYTYLTRRLMRDTSGENQ